jgi:hypothetical protein
MGGGKNPVEGVWMVPGKQQEGDDMEKRQEMSS